MKTKEQIAEALDDIVWMLNDWARLGASDTTRHNVQGVLAALSWVLGCGIIGQRGGQELNNPMDAMLEKIREIRSGIHCLDGDDPSLN